MCIHAQASPYIPLDDPRLPLLEHLIARGEIDDPSADGPSVPALRRACACSLRPTPPGKTLPRNSFGPSAPTFEDPTGPQWRVAGRAGAQAFSHIRRDVLHPLGPDGVRPYADFTGEAVFGDFALVSRLAAEPRVADDPEWPGRTDLELVWRFPEAYVSAQFKYVNLFFGQMDRNWGPTALDGIGVSDYAYSQPDAGFDLGTETLRL